MNSLGKPYCAACGYELTNLTEANKCPECGRLLVDVLARRPTNGIRYKSAATLAGYPLVAIAAGPHEDGKVGRPVGIIALGEMPVGVIAIGVFPKGFIAIGSFSIGFIALGGGAVGVVAVGGLALGALAVGGAVAGLYTIAGVAFYLIHAIGGLRIPLWP